jgi:hypothetical protein
LEFLIDMDSVRSFIRVLMFIVYYGSVGCEGVLITRPQVSPDPIFL